MAALLGPSTFDFGLYILAAEGVFAPNGFFLFVRFFVVFLAFLVFLCSRADARDSTQIHNFYELFAFLADGDFGAFASKSVKLQAASGWLKLLTDIFISYFICTFFSLQIQGPIL